MRVSDLRTSSLSYIGIRGGEMLFFRAVILFSFAFASARVLQKRQNYESGGAPAPEAPQAPAPAPAPAAPASAEQAPASAEQAPASAEQAPASAEHAPAPAEHAPAPAEHAPAAPAAPAAPQEAAPAEHQQKPKGGGAKCPVIPTPDRKPGCEWEPEFDKRYCIISYKCKTQQSNKAGGGDGDNHGEAPEAAESSKCELLNPFEDAVPHPNNDPTCQPGFPGWKEHAGCTCIYTVKERNGGCVTGYWAVCAVGDPNAVLEKSEGASNGTSAAVEGSEAAASQAYPASAAAAPAAPAPAPAAPAAPAAPVNAAPAPQAPAEAAPAPQMPVEAAPAPAPAAPAEHGSKDGYKE